MANVQNVRPNAVAKCDLNDALPCLDPKHRGPKCSSYQIMVKCCNEICGGTTPVSTTTTTTVSTTPTTTKTTTSTVSTTTKTPTTTSSVSTSSTTSGTTTTTTVSTPSTTGTPKTYSESTPSTTSGKTTTTTTATVSTPTPSTTSGTPTTTTTTTTVSGPTTTKTPTTRSESPPSTTSGTTTTSTTSTKSTTTSSSSTTTSPTTKTVTSTTPTTPSSTTKSTTISTTCAYATSMNCYWTPLNYGSTPVIKSINDDSFSSEESRRKFRDSSSEEGNFLSRFFSNGIWKSFSKKDSSQRDSNQFRGNTKEKGSKASKGSYSDEKYNPSRIKSSEEISPLDILKKSGYQVCSLQTMASQIECEMANVQNVRPNAVAKCDLNDALPCLDPKQRGPKCSSYQIMVKCCNEICGGTTPVSTTTTTTVSTTPTTTKTTTSTVSTTTKTPTTTSSVSTSSTTSGTTTTTTVSTPSTTGTPKTYSESTPPTTSGTPTTSSSVSTSSTTSGTATTTSTSSTTSTTITLTSTSGTTTSPVYTSTFTTLLTSSTSLSTPLSTTVSSTTSTKTTGTTTPSFPGTTSPSSSSSTVTTTTHCFCQVNKSLFSPGDILYRTEDLNGCEYYARCSSDCTPERFVRNCSGPTTTTESTPITGSTTTASTTVPTTTSKKTESTTTPSTTLSTPGSTTPLSTTPPCGECECQMPNCGSGYRVVSFLPPGACCVNITCVPDSVCVYGTDVYQRGSIIPQPNGACQTCKCSYDMDMSSGFYAIKCTPIVCDTTCQSGYEYKQRSGQCCGECVAKQCTMKGENDIVVNIEIGKKYRNTNNKCSYYECNQEDGQPVLTKVKTVCQELDITKCDLSTIKYDADGCCRTCEPKKDNKDLLTTTPGSPFTPVPKIPEDCGVRKNFTVLKQDDCEVTVELSYCGGPCMGTSMYSMATKNMDHSCSCCSELEVGKKSVVMACANGARRIYTYTDVLRCGCVSAYCVPDNGLNARAKYSREIQNRRLLGSHSNEA